MPAQATTVGTAFGSSVALTTNSTLIGNVIRIDKGWEFVRKAIETTHSGSTGGWQTYVSGDTLDAGTLEVTCNYDTQLDYKTLFAAGCDTITLTFPKRAVSCGASVAGTAGTFACACVFEKLSPAFPFDDRMAITLTFKLSGAPTFVAAQT